MDGLLSFSMLAHLFSGRHHQYQMLKLSHKSTAINSNAFQIVLEYEKYILKFFDPQNVQTKCTQNVLQNVHNHVHYYINYIKCFIFHFNNFTSM